MLPLLFASTCYADLVSPEVEQQARFRVSNQCSQTLWIQQDYKHSTADPVVVKIEPGMSYDYAIPEKGLASTRFWPKQGCNEQGYQCSVGESTAVPQAINNGWQKAPFAPDINSKFEATWGCSPAVFNHAPHLCASNPSSPGHYLNNETWWNGSAVDGYTLPYKVNVFNHNNSCLDLHSSKVLTEPGVDCSGLSASLCPTAANLSTEGSFNVINGVDVSRVNLQWLNAKTSQPVGCFSPCAKLTTAQGSDNGSNAGGWKHILGGLDPESPEAQMYCCPTPPVSSGQCSAGPAARSAYSQSIAQQRCNAYTYAYDDAKGLARCGSQTKFELIFCPKQQSTPPTPPEPIHQTTMKILLMDNAQASYDNHPISNGQSIIIKNNAALVSQDKHCLLNVSANNHLSAVEGTLCDKLTIDNQQHSILIKASQPTPTGFPLQVNYNTSVGITALINERRLNNAESLQSSDFSQNSTLNAYQGAKSASCALTISSTDVQRGAGELCLRLNIVKEASGRVHIYLPADIPDMAAVTPAPSTNYIHFGMSPSIYVSFLNHRLNNAAKLPLTDLADNQQVILTAYQSANQASCTLAYQNQLLTAIHNSGTLCNAGLSIIKNPNGDIYIGLPAQLPQSSNGNNYQAYQLGIAHGMKITMSSQSIAWNTPEKRINLKEGTNILNIHGNNGSIKACQINLHNTQLNIATTPDCAGVVVHGDVIYFPYF